MAQRRVIFFPNGNTGCFENGQQVPEIQRTPWLTLYLEWLVSQGEDPGNYTFELPNGMIAIPVRVGSNWNWDIRRAQ
jgi:hypothetical protein